MITVSLKGLQLHVSVGHFTQEVKTGNQLVFDVSVTAPTSPDTPLTFIDYHWLYTTVVSIAAAQHYALLEDIMVRINQAIKIQYPNAAIDIRIRKLHPPIGGQVDYAEVQWVS